MHRAHGRRCTGCASGLSAARGRRRGCGARGRRCGVAGRRGCRRTAGRRARTVAGSLWRPRRCRGVVRARVLRRGKGRRGRQGQPGSGTARHDDGHSDHEDGNHERVMTREARRSPRGTRSRWWARARGERVLAETWVSGPVAGRAWAWSTRCRGGGVVEAGHGAQRGLRLDGVKGRFGLGVGTRRLALRGDVWRARPAGARRHEPPVTCYRIACRSRATRRPMARSRIRS